jgi:hypothetical protein
VIAGLVHCHNGNNIPVVLDGIDKRDFVDSADSWKEEAVDGRDKR